MKEEAKVVFGSNRGSRRTFLRSAGLLAVSSPLALAGGMGRVVSKHFEMLAEGVIDPRFVLPPVDLPLPPGLEFRARYMFPIARTRNVLGLQVFVAPDNLPLPLPEAPLLTEPATISYFEVRIDDIQFGTSPVAGVSHRLAAFVLSGRTISNPVLSPFGDLTDAPTAWWSSFEITDQDTGAADFTFLGGAVAGSHATVAPAGKGFIRFGRPA
jgi:hypothetical protein